MPTITFRLSEQDRDELAAKAQTAGMSVSDYIRLAVGAHVADPADRLERLEGWVYEHLEKRLYRLEQLANLE